MNWNPIDQCQYICILTYTPCREVGAPLPQVPLTSSTLITVLGWQAISPRNLSESIMETTVLHNRSHPSRQKFFEFLGASVLSVSHLHSHSSWNTDCVCSAGIPVVSILQCHSKSSWNAHLTREFLQAACSTSRRTTRRWRRGRRRAHLPVPTLSDDEEDGPSMVGGQTSKEND